MCTFYLASCMQIIIPSLLINTLLVDISPFQAARNIEVMREETNSRLFVGRVKSIPNGFVNEALDCGWPTNYDLFDTISPQVT
mgnify:CR=1 FL=1